MKTKRNLILAMAAALLPFTGSSAFAVSIGDSGTGDNKIGAWQFDQGGEFYFLPTSLGGITNAKYASTTKNQITLSPQGSFQTFCLEKGEFLDSPVVYVVNDEAVGGGVNGHLPTGNQNGDILSVGTAWLYSEFASGVLAGYNYGNAGSPNRKADADVLQKAIWALEDELGDPTGNFYFDLAVSHFAALGKDAQANYTPGQFGVYVLNNTQVENGQTVRKQDVLFYTDAPSVPDGGTTVAMLGLALSGMALARRKLG